MNIFNTLYSKMAATLVVLLLVVGILYALLSQSLFKQSYQSSNQLLNQSLALDLVREMKLVKDNKIDKDSMKDAFHLMMLVNPSIEIYFLDIDGKVLKFAAEPDVVKRRQIDIKPIQQFLSGEIRYPLLGDDPRSSVLQKPFSVAALPNADNPVGYLYVVLQGMQYDEIQMPEQDRTLETLGLLALAGSLSIGLLIGLILFYRLTRRIQKLNQSMDRFRGDDEPKYAHREVSGDEIHQLSSSFDAMARRIDEQVNQLQHQDNLRREMVANISHDLRTPLAAIHGYIERLKTRYDELSAQERFEFLDIALHHSQKLNQMIEALFELSKLEAKESQPQIEAFSLSELVQDVLQKFRLQAETRKISLSFQGNDQLPPVSGDIALIDRALSNLVDNAISSTDSGGEVSLSLIEEDDAILVQVRDNGKGIDEKYLPTLFQRFYQVDSRSRDNSRHAGLGLTITHRILELHGQDINVESELGKGSCFRFQLALAARGPNLNPMVSG